MENQGKELSTRAMPNLAISLTEMKDMATAVSKSGLFPAIRTPEAALTLMMLCQAEGIHPVQAMRRFHIIQGQPAMKADAMLAEFMDRGGKVDWLEMTDTVVAAEFTSPHLKSPVKVRWDMERAKKANLTGKDNWKNFPQSMLRARVISEGIRMAMPQVVVGIYTPEEVQDFPDDKLKATAPKVTRKPEEAVSDTPKTEAQENFTPDDVQTITVEIADVKKLVKENKSWFEVYDADGVVYITESEILAKMIKESKGMQLTFSFRHENKKNILVTLGKEAVAA